MRGIAVFMSALLFISVFMLAAVTVGEPLMETVANDETVQEFDAIDEDSFLSNMRWAMFIGLPLVFMTGMFLWGVAWYHRRERVVR